MTVEVEILNTDWTKINSDLTGNVSNFSERDAYIRESESIPDSSLEDGFIIRPGDAIRFALNVGVSLWARSNIAPTKVLVSGGIGKINTGSSEKITDGIKNSEIVPLLKAILMGIEIISNTENLIRNIED